MSESVSGLASHALATAPLVFWWRHTEGPVLPDTRCRRREASHGRILNITVQGKVMGKGEWGRESYLMGTGAVCEYYGMFVLSSTTTAVCSIITISFMQERVWIKTTTKTTKEMI